MNSKQLCSRLEQWEIWLFTWTDQFLQTPPTTFVLLCQSLLSIEHLLWGKQYIMHLYTPICTVYIYIHVCIACTYTYLYVYKLYMMVNQTIIATNGFESHCWEMICTEAINHPQMTFNRMVNTSKSKRCIYIIYSLGLQGGGCLWTWPPWNQPSASKSGDERTTGFLLGWHNLAARFLFWGGYRIKNPKTYFCQVFVHGVGVWCSSNDTGKFCSCFSNSAKPNELIWVW